MKDQTHSSSRELQLGFQEKRARLRRLAASLRNGSEPDMPLRKILMEYAQDSRWEIRQDVAELLVHLPDDDFPVVAGLLVGDPNGYVRRSAERSVSRMRRISREARQRGQSILHLEAKMKEFALEFGEEALKRAMTISSARTSMQINRLVHDQVQLLTPIFGFFAAIRRKPGNKAYVLSTTDKAEQALRLLHESLQDAETYAREAIPEKHLESFPAIMIKAVSLATENVRGIYGEDAKRVHIHIGHLPEVDIRIARQWMLQAFSNLVKNAAEAVIICTGRSDGEVRIHANQKGAALIIEIHDNGCGMEEEDVADRMAEIPCRNPQKKQSTGLGLAISKRFIEAHDGTLSITSKIDVGTRVRITLPIHEDEP